MFVYSSVYLSDFNPTRDKKVVKHVEIPFKISEGITGTVLPDKSDARRFPLNSTSNLGHFKAFLRLTSPVQRRPRSVLNRLLLHTRLMNSDLNTLLNRAGRT